jgi:hypothetical protein
LPEPCVRCDRARPCALIVQVIDWTPSFERIQPDLFAASGGQANAWADADNDGDLDYFVAFRGRPNRFYRNDKGTFRDVALEVGLADNIETRAAAWGDFDADGDADLYIGFADPKIAAKVYRNEASGTRFVDVAKEIGVNLTGVARQPSWIDYDGDGDLDLFAASRRSESLVEKRSRHVRRRHGRDGNRRSAKNRQRGVVGFRSRWRSGSVHANQEGDANGLYRQTNGRFEDVARAMGVARPGRRKMVASGRASRTIRMRLRLVRRELRPQRALSQ